MILYGFSTKIDNLKFEITQLTKNTIIVCENDSLVTMIKELLTGINKNDVNGQEFKLGF